MGKKLYLLLVSAMADAAQMGGLIALGIDISQGAVSSTATSTYIAFLAVMLCGLCLSWTLLPPGRVVRNDGSIFEIHNYVSVKEEIKGLWAAVKTPYILILVPMFFSSNYFRECAVCPQI